MYLQPYWPCIFETPLDYQKIHQRQCFIYLISLVNSRLFSGPYWRIAISEIPSMYLQFINKFYYLKLLIIDLIFSTIFYTFFLYGLGYTIMFLVTWPMLAFDIVPTVFAALLLISLGNYIYILLKLINCPNNAV